MSFRLLEPLDSCTLGVLSAVQVGYMPSLGSSAGLEWFSGGPAVTSSHRRAPLHAHGIVIHWLLQPHSLGFCDHHPGVS